MKGLRLLRAGVVCRVFAEVFARGFAALRAFLLVSLFLFGVVVGVRACHGPFHLLFPVNSPVNSQCLFGSCLTALILMGGRRMPAPLPNEGKRDRAH